MTFIELVELKGRNGSRDEWKFRLGVWLAKLILTALANNPRLRNELRVIMKAAKRENQ